MSRKPKMREPHIRMRRPVRRAKRREKVWDMGVTRGQVRNWTMEVMEKMKEIRRGVEWNLFLEMCVCVYEYTWMIKE